MLRTRFFFGFSVLFLAGGIVVSAQGHSNSPKPAQSPAPKASAAPHATAPAKAPAPPKSAPAKTTSVQTSHAKTASTHPTPAAKAQPAKAPATKSAPVTTTAKASPSKTQKTDKAAPAQAKAAGKTSTSTSTSSDKKTTSTPAGTPTTELTAVQQKLKQNTNLAAKVSSRLPAGTDLMAAAAGFKNLGQFVAAANVSNNLQIPFAELKAKMVTGGMSLGQAIQAVRPLTASPTIEVQRAEYDARGMMADSEQTTPPSTTGGPVTTATTPASAPTSAPSSTVKTKVKAKKPVQ
jgi:hypothetical protein